MVDVDLAKVVVHDHAKVVVQGWDWRVVDVDLAKMVVHDLAKWLFMAGVGRWLMLIMPKWLFLILPRWLFMVGVDIQPPSPSSGSLRTFSCRNIF